MDTKTLKQSIRNLETGDFGTLKDILADIIDLVDSTNTKSKPTETVH